MSACFDLSDLNQFSGGSDPEDFIRHGLCRRVTYTPGVAYLAENAHCYWLIDDIAIFQSIKTLKFEPFQVWTLKVKADKSAKLSCEDGNGGYL